MRKSNAVPKNRPASAPAVAAKSEIWTRGKVMSDQGNLISGNAKLLYLVSKVGMTNIINAAKPGASGLIHDQVVEQVSKSNRKKIRRIK